MTITLGRSRGTTSLMFAMFAAILCVGVLALTRQANKSMMASIQKPLITVRY
jgi:hypothetical protein